MLKRKMIRDIGFNKSQFITIFLMVFVAVLIFSSITSYMDGMTLGVQRYYQENNLQDIWVRGADLTDEDLAEVRSLENVRNAERRLTVLGSIDNIENSTAQINFIESNNISIFYVQEGIGFDVEAEGAWMDAYWAKNNDLTVGDELTIRYLGEAFDLPIIGLIFVPDRAFNPKSVEEIFPTFIDYGFIYLTAYEFPFGRENTVFNYILVDTYNTELIGETKAEIEYKLGDRVLVTDRSSDVSVQNIEAEIEEGNTYVVIFSSIFLFISILSVVTTMNRIVKRQKTEIGILKALGFKYAKIILLYVSYGFWVSLFAALLGIVVGPITIGQYFLNMVLEPYAMPEISVTLTGRIYLVSALVVLLISLVTYISCKKVLKERITYLLKGRQGKTGTRNIDLNKGMLKYVSFSTRWNIRDILRSKARTLMAIVGVAGCAALIICAFGMLNTLNEYVRWQFHDILNFEYRIVLEDSYSDENLDNIVYLYGNNTSKTLNIRIKDGDEIRLNNATVD
ncbi:MAG: ABC transporter permease, partial [Oscillospiraceae bacterium]|nr:ABC transporter permease [Oscillospiraceae bacterium]